jgi:ribosomal-protein-alanine N-acetyltransferase
MVLQLELPGVFVLFDPAGAMVMARVAAGEAEILTLAVLPAQRRQGLAGALMQAAIAQCEALGAEALFLEVATRNQAARALYAGFGFEEVGRRRGYYADGDDALTLRRPLTPAPADPR